MFASKVRATPELIKKALRCWFNDVHYHMLTHDEVQRSVKSAEAVSNMTKDVLQVELQRETWRAE